MTFFVNPFNFSEFDFKEITIIIFTFTFTLSIIYINHVKNGPGLPSLLCLLTGLQNPTMVREIKKEFSGEPDKVIDALYSMELVGVKSVKLSRDAVKDKVISSLRDGSYRGYHPDSVRAAGPGLMTIQTGISKEHFFGHICRRDHIGEIFLFIFLMFLIGYFLLCLQRAVTNVSDEISWIVFGIISIIFIYSIHRIFSVEEDLIEIFIRLIKR